MLNFRNEKKLAQPLRRYHNSAYVRWILKSARTAVFSEVVPYSNYKAINRSEKLYITFLCGRKGLLRHSLY